MKGKLFWLTGMFLVAIQMNVMAKAGVNIYAYNNSAKSVNFTLECINSKESKSTTLAVPPKRRCLLGYVSTDRLVNRTVDGFVLAENIGKVYFQLKNGLVHNKLKVGSAWSEKVPKARKREKLNNNFGDVIVDCNERKWHSWDGTPGFTVTAKPDRIIIDKSEILKDTDRIVIFGDSLSDEGRLFDFSNGLLPSSEHYYNGMFSNSSTWAGMMREQLGRGKRKIRVSNYSVGGATAQLMFDGAHLPYSLKGEMRAFKKDVRKNKWKDLSGFLALTWLGANDYLTVPEDMPRKEQAELVDKTISSISRNTYQLATMGIQNFIFVNLPNLSLVPQCKYDLKNSEVTKKLSLRHNKKLEAMVYDCRELFPNCYFEIIDVNSMFQRYVTNTEEMNNKYGTEITNVTDSCWTGGYIARNNLNDHKVRRKLLNVPDNSDIGMAFAKGGNIVNNTYNYFFWDRVHPTFSIHRALNKYILTQLGCQFKEECQSTFL